MEKKKGIFGDFVKALIVICVSIVLVLSGYAARKYVDFKKEDKQLENNTTNTTETTADEMYKEYIANLKENMSKKLSKNTTIEIRGEDWESGEYYVELNHGNELYVHGAADTEFEVATDVVQTFLVESGQSGNSLLYYIKTDGNLYMVNPASILSGEKITPKKQEYKNIINVVHGNFSDDESGYQAPIFIDIEGNIVEEE